MASGWTAYRYSSGRWRVEIDTFSVVLAYSYLNVRDESLLVKTCRCI